ncbi:ferric iron reductase [Streptomyces sp. SID13666]|uniref:(2Fe-2S)-binding protein n=1 Tax=unclassified Streptomyces TaxID=2593676 RepID=UPI0013BF688B|nr:MULTISPECIES: (2Fe-2S)-binding protein [unclassified Streptomyces]NEA57584.1 ferric iron reductase [Streptomyces sp. SID13666]NEA70912.1 ferric iron reductase [Streptomyces sp. SID13588]
MDRTLRDVAEVGPFFAVRTGPGETGADGGGSADDGPRAHGYRPLAELYATGATDATDAAPAPHPVLERAADVAGRLGTPELRVGASLAFQGLAARLWSVALGAAVLAGRVPDMAADRVWWNPALSAPNDLWLPHPSALPDSDDLAGQLAGTVLAGHLVPLHRATREACPVSGGLLWGNAGSALAGSLRVLHTWCVARGRTAEARSALDLTARLFREPLLSGTGTLDAGGVSFVRRSCCLYYRVPGGGLCGDCVLR